MNLQDFGTKLQELRKQAGLTQKELAEQVFASTDLIAKWERAREHRGRRWQPDRPAVIRLLKLFAGYLNFIEAQTWADQAGHTLTSADLRKIFTDIPWQIPPLFPFYIHRSELEQTLLNTFKNGPVYTLVLQGMGGAGKSTLAAWLAQTLAPDFPDGVVWVDQQGDDNLGRAQEWIARSFGTTLNSGPLAERAGELRSLLYSKRCLLILDDVWAMPDLKYLLVYPPSSGLIVTTRDAKVANLLNAPLVRVSQLTHREGLNLLAAWVGKIVLADELVVLLDGHALALSLSGAQLRDGVTLSELLTKIKTKNVNLSALDMDESQDRAESLTLCFDLSYERLPAEKQRQFAQLSCFQGSFSWEAATAIWGCSPETARDDLRRLVRLALLQEELTTYSLHPLLRAYASDKLATQSSAVRPTWQRYAAWYIRYALYHPAVLDDVTDPAPNLDSTWPDVVAAVRWSARHDSQLATWATLLAHTERLALLAEIGPQLITALMDYLSGATDERELAILNELLGELHLLNGSISDALASFNQASVHWRRLENWLAGSRTMLRAAGAHLLGQDQLAAAVVARQAQTDLEKSLPIAPANLEEARWLFYWFDMVYSPLVRWSELPEADVANLARLAGQTHYPILEARGLHIYRLWCTADVPRPPAAREQGRRLALAAYRLWRVCGRLDRADDEISWTLFRLTGRYSQLAAARFARRRSQTTIVLSQAQIQLVKEAKMRWWLAASETERVAWLSKMLPRYLKATNAPGPPLSADSQEYRQVEEILNVGMLGKQGRWLALPKPRPTEHILNGPEWYVLSGQKTLPLVGQDAIHLIKHYLEALESQLEI